MIIWSRWGLLILVPLALGAATGSLLARIFLSGVGAGAGYGIFLSIGIMLGGVYAYVFNRYVIDRYLDKPRQHVVLEPLPHPTGGQTHRRVPLIHPESGQPLVVKPRSSLLFIPVRVWPVLFVVLGALLLIVSATTF